MTTQEHEEGRLVDHNVSRRDMLKKAGVGGAVAAASFSTLFGIDVVNAQPQGDSPETILNVAATAEGLAVTALTAIVTQAKYFGDLPGGIQNVLKAALRSEQDHLDLLLASGAKQATNKFYAPNGILEDARILVATLDTAETLFVGAYLAATRRFAELGQPLLAELTCQIAGVEAEHRALARAMGGLLFGNPTVFNNIAFERPVVQHVSQAVPFLAKFLGGGSGFFGPVSQPSREQARAASIDLEPVPLAPGAYSYMRKALKK